MNEASLWRLEVAQYVALIITRNPKVAAVMLGGSASRGNADTYSDIEIGVFWNEPPTEADRLAPIEPAGGVFWELDPYDEQDLHWMEEWGLGGIKLDMRNMTLGGIERIIHDVKSGDTSEFRQMTLSAIQYGLPLANEGTIEHLKAQITPYPNALAQAMVQQNLEADQWCWWAELVAQRGDLTLAYSTFSGILEQMLRVLMGLNGIYHPGFKWMHRLIAEMTISPQYMDKRIQQAFAFEPLAAVPILRDLMLETYDLVDAHMPEIETKPARAALIKLRPQFVHKPPEIARVK